MDLANHLVYNGRLRCGSADVAAARLDLELDAGALAGMPAWLQRVRAGPGRGRSGAAARVGYTCPHARPDLCTRRLGAAQGPNRVQTHASLAPWPPPACRGRPLLLRAAAAAEYNTARSPRARAGRTGAGAGGGRAVPGPAGARRGRAAGRRHAVQPGRGGRGVPAGGRAAVGRRAAGRRRRHLALPLPGAPPGQAGPAPAPGLSKRAGGAPARRACQCTVCAGARAQPSAGASAQQGACAA